MEHRIADTPNPETITTSITVPRELWNEVKIIGVRRSTSAQQLTIDALEAYLQFLNDAEMEPETPALTASKGPKSTGEANKQNGMSDKRKSA